MQSLSSLLGSEAWISYFSQTDEKYKELPVYCLMTQRYGATLNTPRITTVYQENTDAKSQVDMLQFMKGFNVKLCYYYEYGVKEDIEFIRNLFPQTENIAIISDNSYAGLSQMKYVENEILSRLANHPYRRTNNGYGASQTSHEEPAGTNGGHALRLAI